MCSTVLLYQSSCAIPFSPYPNPNPIINTIDLMNQQHKRDTVKAESLLIKACDNYSNINACYNLAVLYKKGTQSLHYVVLVYYAV